MRVERMMVAIIAVAIPAVAGLLVADAPAVAVSQRAKSVQVKSADGAPHVVGLNLAAAYGTHTQLLAVGNALTVSTVLPLPTAHSAGMDARAIEQQHPDSGAPGMPDVPDGRKIAIFYTGNVVGEIDPCG